MKADLMVTDARILTMDSARPSAEALAIKKGKILSIGSKADIAGLKGPGTRVLSAQGQSVLPGFIESHMHVFGGGAILDRLDLTGLKGIAAISAAVRNHVPTQPQARVLFGDVVVLSGDIEATPPDAIGTLSPVYTVCGGQVTYEA